MGCHAIAKGCARDGALSHRPVQSASLPYVPHRPTETEGTEMNAVCYLRVSSSTQLDGAGFERQIQACEKLAAKLGLAIVETFREDVSGAKDSEHRPIYQSMLETLPSLDCSIVLVEHLEGRPNAEGVSPDSGHFCRTRPLDDY
jgi:predicted site-specific integrase-resolvase